MARNYLDRLASLCGSPVCCTKRILLNLCSSRHALDRKYYYYNSSSNRFREILWSRHSSPLTRCRIRLSTQQTSPAAEARGVRRQGHRGVTYTNRDGRSPWYGPSIRKYTHIYRTMTTSLSKGPLKGGNAHMVCMPQGTTTCSVSAPPEEHVVV